MRRIAPLALVVALIAAGCGDDDATDSDTSTSSTAAATSSTVAATSSTAASSTTQPAATTEATTTTAAGNPALDAALAREGSYEGQWNNTTFGSSGAISITIDVDEAAQFAVITLDLGGNVFGAADPDPVVHELDLVSTPDTVDQSDELFGDATATMDLDGHFVLVAPMVPGLGGLMITIEGDFTPTGFSGTYVITDLADGTFEGSRV